MRLFIRAPTLALLLGLGAWPALAETSVSALRLGPHPDKTRIVLELSEAPTYRVESGNLPDRVTIRLPEVVWRARLPADRSVGLIADLEIESEEGAGTNLILRGRGPIELGRTFVMPPSEGYLYRLVVDLVAGPAQEQAAAPIRAAARDATRAAAAPPVVPDPVPEPVVLAPAAVPAAKDPPAQDAVLAAVPAPAKSVADPAVPAGARVTVVIDPGHGGFDPGATSLSGVPEKDITLAYAQELERQLTATGRVRVVLTRRQDRFVKLQERRRIAQEAGAQLFISLHADAHADPVWQGASVYTLSAQASDDLAAALAAHANAADLVTGPDLSGANEEVAAILLDLTQRETNHLSRRYAALVIDELVLATALMPEPQRAAAFVVLKMFDVPAILIELGFLSNRQDEAQLRDPDHRRRVAKAILRSLDRHFAQYQAAR